MIDLVNSIYEDADAGPSLAKQNMDHVYVHHEDVNHEDSNHEDADKTDS